MTGQIPYIPAGPVGKPRPAPPATPELDRRKEVIDAGTNTLLGDFLDWLNANGIVLAKWKNFSDRPDSDPRLCEEPRDYNTLLARYFDLDPDKIAKEQDALLAYLREINSQ